MNQLALYGKKSQLQTEILTQANLTPKYVCHKEYQQKLFKKTSKLHRWISANSFPTRKIEQTKTKSTWLNDDKNEIISIFPSSQLQ